MELIIIKTSVHARLYSVRGHRKGEKKIIVVVLLFLVGDNIAFLIVCALCCFTLPNIIMIVLY